MISFVDQRGGYGHKCGIPLQNNSLAEIHRSGEIKVSDCVILTGSYRHKRGINFNFFLWPYSMGQVEVKWVVLSFQGVYMASKGGSLRGKSMSEKWRNYKKREWLRWPKGQILLGILLRIPNDIFNWESLEWYPLFK